MGIPALASELGSGNQFSAFNQLARETQVGRETMACLPANLMSGVPRPPHEALGPIFSPGNCQV